MCNFIIRPVKCFATIDVAATAVITEGGKEPKTQSTILQVGTEITPNSVDHGEIVRFEANGFDNVILPLSVFVHTFSLKDPNKKEEKKKEEKK